MGASCNGQFQFGKKWGGDLGHKGVCLKRLLKVRPLIVGEIWNLQPCGSTRGANVTAYSNLIFTQNSSLNSNEKRVLFVSHA